MPFGRGGQGQGGLKVDSRDALRRGGDSGPAVVPGSLEKSLLYQALLYRDDADYQMPPEGKLPDAVIADFRRWILMGAPDPRSTEPVTLAQRKIDLEAGRRYWAYQPPANVVAPAVQDTDWPRTDIDRFVLSALERHGLRPVEDASPEVLVRRLYFVLTGLPPSPEDAEWWSRRLAAPKTAARSTTGGTVGENRRPSIARSAGPIDDTAVATLIDDLLDSPRFGEHWGRHWLDVARFAESTGGDRNNIFQHAWRYRDWVIDAFNADMPFDQFLRAQIAGDLLPAANDAEWANNIIATGFLAIGPKSVGEEDADKFFADLVDEQIDAVTRAFLATTAACARCHDHKFDPIPQQDYYALAAIFRSTATYYGLIPAQARHATTLLDLTGLGPPPTAPPLTAEKYTALVRARDEARAAVEDAMRRIRSGERVFRGALRRLRSRRDEAEAALQAYQPSGRPRVFAMGVQDRDAPLPTRLLIRGELDKPADLVEPGFLQVLSRPGKQTVAAFARDTAYRSKTARLGRAARRSVSGRLELADWMVTDAAPLTARVAANRVWH